MNIISDSEFLSANNMFETKQKLYRKLNNEKPKHKPCIESGDLRKLSSYFQTNISRPDVNQEFTWFNICYYFGRRGRECWRSLSKNSFEIFTDDEGQRYVAYSLTEAQKNHQSAVQDETDFSDNRMYEQKEYCPVKAYERHLTLLNKDCDALFQKPSKFFIFFTHQLFDKFDITMIQKVRSPI